MKKWLSILLAAGLLLSPFATLAASYESQPSQAQVPPVAQKLVREGDFAIKLAAELNLGKPAEEAEAENLLATAGIVPVNGWISDYPVTPEIIGQLNDSIKKAADEGRMKMTAQEANKALTQLAGELSLPVPASGETAPSAQSNPTVINNYYYNQGPPVVTYYPPPADYLYLYDWVPFPAVWFGFFFPGFFICHHFTTTVFVSAPFLSVNATFAARRAIVSNVIFDRASGRFVAVDPVVRTSTGRVRAITALHGTNGRSFATFSDMRRGTAMSGVSPVRTWTSQRNSSIRSGAFASPQARNSAAAIVSRSVQRMNPSTRWTGNSRMNSRVGPSGMGRGSGGTRSFAPRTFSRPSLPHGHGSGSWSSGAHGRWRG